MVTFCCRQWNWARFLFQLWRRNIILACKNHYVIPILIHLLHMYFIHLCQCTFPVYNNWLYSWLQLGVHSVVFPMLRKQVCERSAISCGGRKWRVFQHLMCLKCVPWLQTLTREHGFRYLCPPHRKCERLDIQKTPAAWTPAKYLSLKWVCVIVHLCSSVWVFWCCVRLDGVLCKINVSTKSFLENDKYLLSASRQK